MRLGNGADLDPNVRVPLHKLDDLYAPLPLPQDAGGVVGHTQGTADCNFSANGVQVGCDGIDHFAVALGGHNDVFPVVDGRLDGRQ